VKGRWEAMSENPPEIERDVDENMAGARARQPSVSQPGGSEKGDQEFV